MSDIFSVGRVQFSVADYPYLLGNFLILVGVGMIMFFSFYTKSSPGPEDNATQNKVSPEKSKKEVMLGMVESPMGRRSARIQSKDITPVKGKKSI
jgi:hypothetical protein